MELNIRLVTRPAPETRTRVLVVIIVIIAVVAIWAAGYGPSASIPVLLAAALAGARVADAVTAGSRKRLPGTGPADADTSEPL